MRSIAVLNRFNSFSLNRLLRKEYVTRATLAGKVFLALCCVAVTIWMVAQMVSDFLLMRTDVQQLASEIDRKIATTKEGPTAQRKNFDYSRISGQQIFGKIGAVAAPSAPTVQTPPVSNVALKLIGTFLTTGEAPTAIIEDTKKPGSQEVFGIGEMIFGEAKLTAVYADRVEIDRNGKREILTLDESAAAGAAGESPGGNTVVVDETELDSALANLPMLLTQARAVPYFKDGKSVGLRLFAIRRGSLFEKIGLQNGDILKEINGNSLSDITQAVKLFEKLKEQRDVAVTLERQREEQTYRYLIR